ncbi:MAG TPA: helix-turn-helix domain-containing protein [Acidimicrobiales bacterium]|nr:helix-turn-helix domain-containing protein [Acidimicrobiales bacterium]
MTATTSLALKPLLSIEEAAILLGETRSTLYRAVKQPDFPLPVHRIGKRLRIPRRAVERLIDGLPAQRDDQAEVRLRHQATRSSAT